jgi:hypothetical protein
MRSKRKYLAKLEQNPKPKKKPPLLGRRAGQCDAVAIEAQTGSVTGLAETAITLGWFAGLLSAHVWGKTPASIRRATYSPALPLEPVRPLAISWQDSLHSMRDFQPAFLS